MKYRLSILSSLFLISLMFITLVFATSFTATVSPNIADSGLTNKFVNFTINNINSANITQLNITLDYGLTVVGVYNGTTASDTTFTKISSTSIGWSNTTPQGFVNTTQYFWFNVSIPKTTYGTVNFNITTNDTSGSFNSTNVSISVERTVWSSPLEQFYIKPVEIYLNWTNNYTSNITITLNTSLFNITVEILDSTTYAVANYSQSNSDDRCKSGDNGYRLYVRNISGGYNNIVANNTNITIVDRADTFNHLTCSPGRYWIDKLTVRNYTQTNESANITVFIDIPISSSNNANIQTTGTGSFSGRLPINTTYYHSYYFNTSLFTNATAVLVNVSGWSSSQDVDLFLLDGSGNLNAKSINKSSTNESLLYNYLPLNETWEIRIYGNSTTSISYTGNLIFTTLNITNASNTNQQISSINFGMMNASNTTQANIILKNEGNLNLSNVIESKELYHVKRFSGSSAQNFTFLVPDSSIASKVKISLNWTGGSNYSFELYNQTGILVANSTNKYVYANQSRVMQEEYGETTNIGSSVGVWRVEVKNNTNVTDSYSVAAYIYVNASAWITTNYTTSASGLTFNMSGRENSSYSIQINFTVQNNTLDGLYEGSLQYLDINKVGVKIPLYVNVTTPVLAVNNTMVSMTGRVDENYGVSLTRYNTNFILNNTGFYDLSISLTNSSNILRCVSGNCNSSYFANFTYNQTTSIGKYSYQLISVNITFNSSLPTGVYDGWIFVNGTNTTTALESHPYSTFNITVRLNLTSLLDVRVVEVNTTISNISADGNITVKTKLYYLNGTSIEAGEALNASNFTVWLVETNITSQRVPSTGGLNVSNSTPINTSDVYTIKAIVPANQVGGRYNVYVSTNYTRNPSFVGEGANNSLIINNTGLYMTTSNSTSISLGNTSTYLFAVNVSNYGPLNTSSATIQFSESCAGYSVGVTGSSGCSGALGSASQSGTTFTIYPNGYTTSCLVWWTITAGSSAADACTGNIIGTPSNGWFNPNGINVSVTVTAPSAGTGAGTGAGQTLPTYVADLSFTKAESLIIVRQNSTNTTEVAVKNSGNKSTQYINFSIEGINSTWYTLNSTLATLAIGKSAGFLATFSVSDVDVKDYSGTFKANSTDKSITSSFTLRVTPAPAKQIEINETLVLYRLNFTKLGEEINQSKKSGVNVTLAEQKYNLTKTKLEQAENYIKQGDYFSANQLLSEIKSLLNDSWTELDKAKEAKPFDWTWIIVGVGIVAVVVGAYLFWPTKVESLQKVQVPIEKENVWDKLKDKWDEIRKKRSE